jgi:branched-chain amino acid transport system permease protein
MNRFRELWQTRRIPFILLIILVVVMLAIPVAFSREYVLYIVIGILILALFSLSVNLLLGYTGLLSFGQAAFFGVGAFAAAKVLLANANVPLAMIGGMAAAALVALILGFICVRHTAIYFAMLTLAFGMLFYAGVQKVELIMSAITGVEVKAATMFGGAWGLLDIPRGPIFNFPMNSLVNYYYFTLVVAGIAIFLFYRLVHSPLGLSFKAIRDSESRVAFTGISVRNRRLLCFVIAGVYAGLAGALRTAWLGNVDPLVFHWSTSAAPIVATLLGGMYTFAGPIVGAAVYYIVKERVFVAYSAGMLVQPWQLAIGLIIVALVLGLPGGIVGIIEQRFLPWLRARFAQASSNKQEDIRP